MKKTFVLLVSVAFCLQGFAQNSKVTSAIMHMQTYGSQRDSTEVYAAKGAIDEAAVNEKTKDEPKMYLTRGEVYLNFFSMRLGNILSKAMKSGQKSGEATAAAYTSIDTNSICVAVNSFIKVLQIEPKGSYSDEAKDRLNLPTAILYIQNKALLEYKAGRYASAFNLYQKAVAAFNVLNITDSNYKNTVQLVATSANKAGNIPMATMYYQKMIDLKYGGSIPYHALSSMYLEHKDTVKGLDYLEKGRAIYPDDVDLIITLTNFYLQKQDFEKASDNLTITIAKVEQKPKNTQRDQLLTSLYTTLGGIYDRKANPPKDATGNDAPKPANYDELFTKADTNYSKALALSPDNFDILHAKGALLFNRAVPLTNQANALPLNDKAQYDKLMAQAKVYIMQAEPYIEKAHNIKPGDADNTNALIQIYVNTDQNEKAEALKAKK